MKIEKLEPSRHRQGRWLVWLEDGSLVRLGEDFGFDELDVRDQWPRLGELPFDSDRKLMSTVHRFAGGYMLVTKGAVDVMLDRTVLGPGEREEIERVNQTFSNQGLRVLAFACRRLESTEVSLEEENNMLFLGLIAMMDPPRAESKEAVAHCIAAGIRPIMITGDHVVTASAIAREIGILTPGTQAVEGAVIESMTDQELQDFVPQVSVYARVSPEHKIRIVRAWQERGALVAMTGDGINDAPALRSADVGVAMGKGGTDVARNAADLILTDDNFSTIEKAIREGRGIYENIRKTILFLLSSNFGEIITMLAAVLAGFPATLKASHILWVNLITDSLPALALGMDGNDGEELMKQPPRKSTDTMFSHGGLSCTLCFGVVIGVISILAFMAVPYEELLQRQLPVNLSSMKKILEIEWILNKAQTHAFTVLGMSQLVHAVGMRDVNRSVFRMKHFENLYMLAALGIGLLLQVLVTEVPYLITLFETNRLTLGEWGRLQILSLTPLAVHELLCLFTAAGQKQVRAEEVH